MANGIPPFLPASPPPMCNLDFYDDEDDDFGEFSNAAENCYQDDISITKSIGDEETNNTTQVFDPGAKYTPLSETLIRNKDYSYDNSSQLVTPVTHSVENESNFINESSEIDDMSIPKQNCIQNDPTEKNDSTSEAATGLNENDSCTYFKDDESSAEDSTSDSCDKDVPRNQTNNSINSNNDSYLENSVANDTIKPDHDLPPDNNFNLPDSIPAVEDDFNAFCNVTEPNETVANHSISEQTKPDLQRAFSEDSDDSNTPDIDFNCFITCQPDFENQQSNSNSLDYDDKPFEDEFGDFANPAEVDFTISHPSSSIQSHENVESVRESCLDTKPTAQNPTDQTHNLLEKSLDDDFSDFVSTTELPTMEGTVNTNTEQNNFFDQSKSIEECQSETGTSQISFDGINFNVNATPSLSHDLEKMYDIDDGCWNEIFQGSEEEHIEVNLNTFEGKLNGSSVWCKIKDIETSPALTYNWNNSETQKILLSALYVDSRNILFGPRWNSDVPRFASNLGFSPLVPEKAVEKKDTQPISISPQTVLPEDPIVDDSASKVPASVPDAHFDWNNSGLTNPLDNHSHSSLLDLDLLASFDIHSPYYKNNRKNERTKGSVASTYENSLLAKTPHRTELSEEAKEILNNLPNLYVMEKQYIVFPVS